MRTLRSRLSPALVVALIALAVAMGGTAVATGLVMITRPEQLAKNVVVKQAIATAAIDASKVENGTLRHADQQHPVLRARVRSDGTLDFDASDAQSVVHTMTGEYRIAFDRLDLARASDLRGCVFTATMPNHVGGWVTANWGGAMDVVVQTRYPDVGRDGWGNFVVNSHRVDMPFDLIAAC